MTTEFHGIGPRGSSLLNKLGIKRIDQLTDDELRELVLNDRTRRSQVRALGRAKRMMQRPKTPATRRNQTLDSFGLAPALVTKLRSTGKSDSELILLLKEKGII